MAIRAKSLPVTGSAIAILLTSLSMLALSPGASASLLDQWGVLATTSVCADAFDCGSTTTDGPVDGDFMVNVASSSVDNGADSAQAHSELVPANGISAPTLKAEAISGVGGSALATAFAVEIYTNTSGAAQDLIVEVSVTDAVLSGFASVSTSLIMIKAALVSIEADVQDLIDALTAALTADPPIDILSDGLNGNDSVTIGDADKLIFDLDTLEFVQAPDQLTLQNGESAYFLATLTALGAFGGSADAFGTLTATVQGPDNFSAASTSAAPEPAPLGLLLLGLAALAVQRRLAQRPL